MTRVAAIFEAQTSREQAELATPTVEVPRGTELMRKVGVEPEMRVVDVLGLG